MYQHLKRCARLKFWWELVGMEYALDDLWSNDLARSAPRGEAVEHEQCVFDLERLGPVVLPASC
jgi:hypothetical protein